MEYTRFLISEMHLGKFPDSMEFQSWKVNFKTEVCSKTADPHLAMNWIKEVEIEKSIDELTTSRSLLERTDFPDYDMLDAMIPSALKKASQHARSLPFNIRLQNDDVQDFDVEWDQALLSASEIPTDVILGRIVQVKTAGFCSASDCRGFVRPRNCQKQWTTELLKIKIICETSY